MATPLYAPTVSSVAGRFAFARSTSAQTLLACTHTSRLRPTPAKLATRCRCRPEPSVLGTRWMFRGCAIIGVGASLRDCTHPPSLGGRSWRRSATSKASTKCKASVGVSEHEMQKTIESGPEARRKPNDRPRPCGGCIKSAKPSPDFASAKSTRPQAASEACHRRRRCSLATKEV